MATAMKLNENVAVFFKELSRLGLCLCMELLINVWPIMTYILLQCLMLQRLKRCMERGGRLQVRYSFYGLCYQVQILKKNTIAKNDELACNRMADFATHISNQSGPNGL